MQQFCSTYYSNSLRFLLLFFLIVFSNPLIAQVPFVCQNNFYFSFGSNFGSSQLHEVILDNSGNVDFIPLPQSTGVNLNAIGYRSTDNLIYGVGTQNETLYQIDATGRSFSLGILDVNHSNGFYAAAITPDGNEMILVEQTNTFGGSSVALVKIDLTNDQYATIARIPLVGPTVQTTDIAFDPITGILYGFDADASRLITIDPDNGTINANFPSSNVADRMGGLYFDAFGKMFGYGNAQNDNNARTFFGINKETGIVTNLGNGPNTSSKDGCACPFTVDLLKNVTPRQLVPCTEIAYAFEVSNLSGAEITGIDLSDTMPIDFIIVRVDQNPYGGIVEGLGTNILTITNMTVPLGQDSLVVIVEPQPFALGVYKNQAYLDNLPEHLGSRSPSDDPLTLLSDDSTAVEVFPLMVDLENQMQNLCEGATIELVAGTIDGIDYEWSTGATTPTINVSEPGLYAVTITNGCEIEFDSVIISEEPISVDLGEDIIINLGDYIDLIPITNAIGQLQYVWSNRGQTITCPTDCSALEERPFFDTQYEVQIISQSGCMATSTVNIAVTKERDIFIPNVFSPNLDGINDKFYIMGKGYAQILVFQVFDRWGNVVFSQNQGSINDENIGWDGSTDGKNVENGVFSYYAKVIYLDEIEESFYGDVTLIK
ncbi:MAG: gliding motility-associated C-terminal domain-containing protein [Saprospiraceae bacterium]